VFATNHVLSGVAIGRVLAQRPATAFMVGVASHLALDMVPHWGCQLGTVPDRQQFLRYARRDGILGLVVALGAVAAVDRRVRLATLAAIAGATLLDADKPALYFWRRNPWPQTVRTIHAWVQNESPKGMPNEIAFGVSCALADAVIVVQSRRRSATQ
jgi:hypothetical protein